MPTLIYCTAYAQAPSLWRTRYRPWVESIKASAIKPDQILLVDDGSHSLPGWPDSRISSGDHASDAPAPAGPGTPILHHFAQRLGRRSIYDFPGWHRSFAFGALYAEAHGFDRVIHLESDAYLLSARAQEFFRDYQNGWCALWSERYRFPEIALQVIAGDQIANFVAFARKPYDHMIEQVHEKALPLTHIERGFTGDRYGENAEQIPPELDYVCQVPCLREPAYYGWRANPPEQAAAPLAGRLDFDFGATGNAAPILGIGWAGQEPKIRWMINAISTINLPPLAHKGAVVLHMLVLPHVNAETLFVQKLIVILNDRQIDAFDVTQTTVLGTIIPADALKQDGANVLRFIHPDAAPPRNPRAEHPDRRKLAIAVQRLSLIPTA